jgi:lipopolysaccharide transport system permease protein
VRYKQTVLGAAWAVIPTIFNVVIMTVIFGGLANFRDDLPPGLPFSIWMFAGLLPWMLISAGITAGGSSLINSQHLLTKIYFPRLFVPTAAVGGTLVDLIISAIVFLLVMVCARVAVSWQIVLIPLLLIPTVLASLGFAYLLAALTVSYRDFKHFVPFLAQAMMWMSAVFMPLTQPLTRVPMKWQLIGSLNPAFGIIDAYRSAIFGLRWNPWNLVISSAVATILFLFGLYFFRRMERRFADVL